jgi:uncharacterized protein (TIGR00304 family)
LITIGSCWQAAGEEILDATTLYIIGIALIVVGVLIVVAVILCASAKGAKKGEVKGAGVIMIGPIPIIFGTDKESVKTVLALALTLSVVLLTIFVLYWFLR